MRIARIIRMLRARMAKIEEELVYLERQLSRSPAGRRRKALGAQNRRQVSARQRTYSGRRGKRQL